MSALDIADRDRLAACLALAESDANPHAGERAAAIAAAERLLAKRGMRLRDLADIARPAAQPPQATPGWRTTVAACLQRMDCLTGWEVQFLVCVAARGRLSPRQREVLNEIARKAGVREASP